MPRSLCPKRCVVERLEGRRLLSGDVLTYHNDNARTGANLAEKVLTPANVAAATFGKLFDLPVDGKVDAQPLFVSNLKVGRSRHDVALVVTEHDSLYAFDAATGARLYQATMLPAGEVPSDPHLPCGQIYPEIGITATPVIDRRAGPHGTIFVVAMSKDAAGQYHQRLHAVDLATGADRLPPRDITATYPGTGDNSANGQVIFDPGQYDERCALLLSRGVVYTSWGSHCDIRPYTSWVMGFREKDLAPSSVLNLTPNGSGGAFWACGGGPAADAAGNLFLMAGNGDFDPTLNASGFPSRGDLGNAFLQLSTRRGLRPIDYFSEYNQAYLNSVDFDLGSSMPMLLPPMTDAAGRRRLLAIGAGKDGNIFLLDRRHMGKLNTATADNRNAYQEVSQVLAGGVFSLPAYFNNRVYYGPVGDVLRAFDLSRARLSSTSTSQSASTFVYPGTTPSVSANGKRDGIVWAVENANVAVLHAYDANNLGRELYNSGQSGTRDQFGAGNKFITPMIAGGKVFVGTTNSLAIFGLLRPA